MKQKISVFVLLSLCFSPLIAQVPHYLDNNVPIEERVEDALGRMTLDEKIAMIHAQSKFSSPGVPRLVIPEEGPYAAHRAGP